MLVYTCPSCVCYPYLPKLYCHWSGTLPDVGSQFDLLEITNVKLNLYFQVYIFYDNKFSSIFFDYQLHITLHFALLIKTEFGCTIYKSIEYDNGSEYNNTVFHKFLASQGTQFCF